MILAGTLSGAPPLDPGMLKEDHNLSNHEATLKNAGVLVLDDGPSASAPVAEAPPSTKPVTKTPRKQGGKRPQGPEGEILGLPKERREQTGETEFEILKIERESQERMQTERLQYLILKGYADFC